MNAKVVAWRKAPPHANDQKAEITLEVECIPFRGILNIRIDAEDLERLERMDTAVRTAANLYAKGDENE
jgi:hypothetical protein